MKEIGAWGSPMGGIWKMTATDLARADACPARAEIL
jgi:hypothetical protein